MKTERHLVFSQNVFTNYLQFIFFGKGARKQVEEIVHLGQVNDYWFVITLFSIMNFALETFFVQRISESQSQTVLEFIPSFERSATRSKHFQSRTLK